MKNSNDMKKLVIAAAAALLCAQAQAQDSADARAAKAVAALTPEEKIKLVFGYFSTDFKDTKKPEQGIDGAAGFVYGIERLGIPAQQITDAGIGVATQPAAKTPRVRTALPANIAIAASWNPATGFAGGAMIGNEAHLSGHNVMLAGGADLQRDPRNGRNFEYAGEDPLLTGVMVGEQIRGIQSNHVISTLKHFAYNDQETGRFIADVKIDDPAGRMSDLLGFQIAIERGNPGSIMCSYNRLHGVYACENGFLLNQVLKGDWGYKGYVMSDWGGTHSTTQAALAGLDQQSGWPFDKSPYFNGALLEAVQNGHVPEARLNDMARRILRSMYAHGLVDDPAKVQPERIDYAAHAKVSQAAAEDGMVLLKNDKGLLPLADGYKTIAVIGGHADAGVLSGGGSSQVYPEGGSAVPNEGPTGFPGPIVYHRSSPLKALAARLHAKFVYHDGKDAAAAAKLAAASDLAIVFATQWTAESVDQPDIRLPHDQDATIAAVAAANGKTVVVLETGSPVAMPWLGAVGAVVEAWYPGNNGGEAIARVLTGEVDAAGRLPSTFPADESQLPRPKLDGRGLPEGTRFSVDYDIEGAAVGYKWFDKKGLKPLFAFGHGLSYTKFGYAGLKAVPANGTVKVSFNVANTGKRDGKAVPQVYVAKVGGGWEAPKRLGGWDKLALRAGENRDTTVVIDPRILAVFDGKSHTWKVAAGEYKIILAEAADAPVGTVTVKVPAREFAAGAK